MYPAQRQNHASLDLRLQPLTSSRFHGVWVEGAERGDDGFARGRAQRRGLQAGHELRRPAVARAKRPAELNLQPHPFLETIQTPHTQEAA